MIKKLAILVIISISLLIAIAGTVAVRFWVPLQGDLVPKNISQGIAIPQKGLARLQADLSRSISAAPVRVMNQSGLAGAMGGAHVRLFSGDSHEVLLPIPQLADGQVPICYFISSTPPDAITEFRIRKREDCNAVASVRLAGNNKDVQIAWSSVVLLASRNITPNSTAADPYRTATSCVQSHAAEITKLGLDTWPTTGGTTEFATNIQRYIREMTRKEQPRSLDAVGILQSGASGICTANANLASALMRSKGFACRTIAVIPPISQRLEMHRIVEFSDGGRWIPFDPSSLQVAIPTKPWHYIVMAKTTPLDEQMAMKPRMGSMLGCPYGQEIEMLSAGVSPCGQDFFWTVAKPLAEFEPTDEAIRLATAAWNHYLETGTLTQGQLNGGSAKTAARLVECMRIK